MGWPDLQTTILIHYIQSIIHPLATYESVLELPFSGWLKIHLLRKSRSTSAWKGGGVSCSCNHRNAWQNALRLDVLNLIVDIYMKAGDILAVNMFGYADSIITHNASRLLHLPNWSGQSIYCINLAATVCFPLAKSHCKCPNTFQGVQFHFLSDQLCFHSIHLPFTVPSIPSFFHLRQVHFVIPLVMVFPFVLSSESVCLSGHFPQALCIHGLGKQLRLQES